MGGGEMGGIGRGGVRYCGIERGLGFGVFGISRDHCFAGWEGVMGIEIVNACT